jgi:hypothetical protein
VRKNEILRGISERYGFANAARFVLVRTLNKFARCECLEILTIDTDSVDRSYLDLEPEFTSGWVGSEELRALAVADPSLQMSREFLNEAWQKKDRCYGIFFEGGLASYGWYSTCPTAVRAQLTFCFYPQYTYMYKGYTKPDFRGNRLHAIGMSKPLMALSESGGRGIVSYVDYTNFASLRSCDRMGYERRGKVLIMGETGHYRTWTSPGCKHLGVRVSVAIPTEESADEVTGKQRTA